MEKLCPICKGNIVSYPNANDTVFRCENNRCHLHNVAMTKKVIENPIFEIDAILNNYIEDINSDVPYIQSTAISNLKKILNR